jgi:phospholipid/cholesterol/gamma-HCH transport system substrate-binding protein
MENRASYTLVGGFVLALLVVGAIFVSWLARFELADNRTYYYIYFRGSVAGLSEGSTVRLRGVPIGTVTRIEIDAKNIELIEVTIAVKSGTPIKTNTVAQLAAQGITGLAYISLSGGTTAAEILRPREGKRRATIPSIPSPLERLFEEAPNVIASANLVAERAATLLSEDNVNRITNILVQLESLVVTAADRRQDIEILFDDLRKTMASAKGVAENADGLVKDARGSLLRLENETVGALADTRKLMRDADRLVVGAQPAISDLRQTAQNFAKMATQLEALARDTRTPVRNFADQGLYEFSQFVVEARQLVAALQRLSLQMERDPARFLFGDQTRGFEPSRREPPRR